MGQDEAAGPVGDLGHPGGQARLPEERRLLVAGQRRTGSPRSPGAPGTAAACTGPIRPHVGTTSASAPAGTPKSSHSSSDHRARWMS